MHMLRHRYWFGEPKELPFIAMGNINKFHKVFLKAFVPFCSKKSY